MWDPVNAISGLGREYIGGNNQKAALVPCSAQPSLALALPWSQILSSPRISTTFLPPSSYVYGYIETQRSWTPHNNYLKQEF